MDDEFIIEFSENNELCISNPSPGTGEAEDSLFAFDHCYEPDSQSETVFEQMGRPLVDGLYAARAARSSRTARRGAARPTR